MTYAQTLNQLSELHLKGMVEAYRELCDDPLWREMSFDDRLAQMVNREYDRRLNNRIRLRIKEAGFKEQARLSEILYTPDRNLNRELIERFSQLRWIKNHENIIITGATGTGKSYLAQALGEHACRHGYRVKYYRLPDLLCELNVKKQVNQYIPFRRLLAKTDVLILDDWGMAILDKLSGHEVGEIIEDRLHKKSVIVVSQFPIGTWDRVFEDKTTADAVMDRLVHVAYPLGLGGPSLRQQAASDELRAFKNDVVE